MTPKQNNKPPIEIKINPADLLTAAQMLAALITLVLVLAGSFAMFNRAVKGAPDRRPSFAQIFPYWELLNIRVNNESVTLPQGRQPVGLNFRKGLYASGNGGCNQFSAAYSHSSAEDGLSGILEFDALTATEMGCDADDAEFENAYFLALSQVSVYKIDGFLLRLSSEDGAYELIYQLPRDEE